MNVLLIISFILANLTPVPGITLIGEWSRRDRNAIVESIDLISTKLSDYVQVDKEQTISVIFGQLTLILLDVRITEYGCRALSAKFAFNKNVNGFECGWDLRNHLEPAIVIHEIGHVFDTIFMKTNQRSYAPWHLLHSIQITTVSGEWVTGKKGAGFQRGLRGYRGTNLPYMAHPPIDELGENSSEEFADMFMNWVLGTFSDDEYGEARDKWMDEQMEQWLVKILVLRGKRPILIEHKLSLCIWNEKWQCEPRALHE